MPFKNAISKDGWKYLLFYFPVIVSYLFDLFGKHSIAHHYFAEALLFASLLLAIHFLLPWRALRKIVLTLFYCLLLIGVFIRSYYLHLYDAQVEASTIYILLETNASEAIEYIDTFTSPVLYLFLAGIIIPSVVIIRSFWKSKGKTKSLNLKQVAAYLLTALSSLFLLQSCNLGNFNFYYSALKANKEYRAEAAKFRSIGITEKTGGFLQVEDKSSHQQETLVVIIGESTTRDKMSLYGYYRPTTPYLDSLSNLQVYTDVISPHTHTIPSLTKALLLPDQGSGYIGSVIQLYNQAGYKSYWLSNQQPVGVYDTFVTRISEAANERLFLNPRKGKFTTPLDGALLPVIEKALADDADKKIIFVHLMGTHAKYSKRYPTKFGRFKDMPQTDYTHERAVEMINAYDNAVLYQDSIMHEIIEMTGRLDYAGQVVYFSDHGEEVYQTVDDKGHTESDGTKPMYDIPFLHVYNSFVDVRHNSSVKDSAFMIDDLLHSLADLSSISFSKLDSTKSIFNPAYIPKERLILNNKPYDSYFEN